MGDQGEDRLQGCEFQSCFLPQFCYSPSFAKKEKKKA